MGKKLEPELRSPSLPLRVHRLCRQFNVLSRTPIVIMFKNIHCLIDIITLLNSRQAQATLMELDGHGHLRPGTIPGTSSFNGRRFGVPRLAMVRDHLRSRGCWECGGHCCVLILCRVALQATATRSCEFCRGLRVGIHALYCGNN